MKCPYCDSNDNKVIDSRPADESNTIKRRRECLNCEARFTTYEKIETLPVIVVKRDNSRQPFEREKILKGLLRACAKRPVSRETLDWIVDKIEIQLGNSLEGEVTSSKIGELVLEQLRGIDEVAYVRFASVYRDFADIDTFMHELRELRQKSK